jgi:hypothetical protein
MPTADLVLVLAVADVVVEVVPPHRTRVRPVQSKHEVAVGEGAESVDVPALRNHASQSLLEGWMKRIHGTALIWR